MNALDIQIKEFEFSDREYKQLRELIPFTHENTKSRDIKDFAYYMFYNVYDQHRSGHVHWFKPKELDLFLSMLKEVSANPNAPSFAKDFEKTVLEVLNK